ncbi:MAG: hypothetical protein ACT4NY_17410 [Pseudonocardiales bacterium]
MTALDTAAPAPGSEGGPFAAEMIYRGWGWPVILRREQVWLALESEAVALLIPAVLATEVAVILADRYCPSAMLTHPYAPEHRVLLAGEPFPVMLSWPPGVHRVTTCLLLPPAMTPRGPLTWTYPPQPEALRLCREIDVLAALHAGPRVRHHRQDH